MAYTVLARRYRSDSFGDVVGQEPIAKTLCNAIRQGRVAHAYLFTGTRGVGKTSVARLLARALNAPDTLPDAPKPKDKHDYPPKDVQQRMADAIMRGEDLNVIEIDAASNRGVDEARQLIANAGLAPTGNARYKIYIIDEVHQLTRDAFNALLKTMEEPPGHVKFVLCTTEAHKVPATIQSRCQRFDFRNIPTAAIAEHLQSVLQQEKIEAEPDLVHQVARLGNGSMRDALSLLDRLIAAGQQPLTLATLEQMLGLPPREGVIKLIDALADGDVAAALKQADAVLTAGTAIEQMLAALTDRLHTLMLLAACGADTDLVDLPQEAKTQAAEQAVRFDAAGLSHMIALCENLARSLRASSAPRAMLDATMVRLALAEKMADVTALLAGAPAAPPTSAPAGVAADPKKKAAAAVEHDLSQRREVTRASDGIDGPDDDPWAHVLARAAANQATGAWVSALELAAVADGVATVRVRPGRRDMLRFMSDARRDQLARWLSEALSSGVRVRIEAPTDLASPTDDAPRHDAAPAAQGDRQAAMALPLVRQVMEHFDAALVQVSRRTASRPCEDNQPESPISQS